MVSYSVFSIYIYILHLVRQNEKDLFEYEKHDLDLELNRENRKVKTYEELEKTDPDIFNQELYDRIKQNITDIKRKKEQLIAQGYPYI